MGRAIHRNEPAKLTMWMARPEKTLTASKRRAPRRSANQFGESRVAQRQRAERRIEVDVGGVNEAERHYRELIDDANQSRLILKPR